MTTSPGYRGASNTGNGSEINNHGKPLDPWTRAKPPSVALINASATLYLLIVQVTPA